KGERPPAVPASGSAADELAINRIRLGALRTLDLHGRHGSAHSIAAASGGRYRPNAGKIIERGKGPSNEDSGVLPVFCATVSRTRESEQRTGSYLPDPRGRRDGSVRRAP